MHPQTNDQLHIDREQRRRHRLSSFALMLAVTAGCVTACGGSDSAASGGSTSNSASASTSGGASSSTSTAGGGELTDAEWQVQMATCLRRAGYEVSDPKAGEGLSIPQAADMAAVAEAMQTCQTAIGGPSGPSDPNEDATGMESQEETLKLAACLRREGYDVADPKAGQPLLMPVDIPADVQRDCRKEALK